MGVGRQAGRQADTASAKGHCRTRSVHLDTALLYRVQEQEAWRGGSKCHKGGGGGYREKKNRREAWGSGVNTVDRKTEREKKTDEARAAKEKKGEKKLI